MRIKNQPVTQLTEIDALSDFLSRALEKRRVDRFVGLIQSPKGRVKFLDSLHHDLERSLQQGRQLVDVPSAEFEHGAYLFCPREGFGVRRGSVREVLESNVESCLVVRQDGMLGVYCPETYIDSRMYYLFK